MGSLLNFWKPLTDNIYFQFLFGTIGIYITAFAGSIIHQKLLKVPYYSNSNKTQQLFPYAVGLVMFPYLSGWIVGSAMTWFSGEAMTEIPRKNLIYCAVTIFTATLTYNIAIVETSYPIVIMVKSCSILSVIVVGVFFSRVKDKQNKLGKNKLVVGVLVTTGILLYNVFAQSTPSEKSVTMLGIVLLLASLVADGFLPDFQAQIKTVYKPPPNLLMAQINKWVFILTVFYSILRMEFLPIFYYIYDHPTFAIDLVLNAFMSSLTQLFVYYLIQKFRQHIVPFVITIRKILSVVISILWFHHSIGPVQWVGIVIVFMAAVFDFVYEKYCAGTAETKVQRVELEKVRIMDDSVRESITSTQLEDQIEKALGGLETGEATTSQEIATTQQVK